MAMTAVGAPSVGARLFSKETEGAFSVLVESIGRR
jgi:hypothetical protein